MLFKGSVIIPSHSVSPLINLPPWNDIIWLLHFLSFSLKIRYQQFHNVSCRVSLKLYLLSYENTQVYFTSDQIDRFRTRLRPTIYPLGRHISKWNSHVSSGSTPILRATHTFPPKLIFMLQLKTNNHYKGRTLVKEYQNSTECRSTTIRFCFTSLVCKYKNQLSCDIRHFLHT